MGRGQKGRVRSARLYEGFAPSPLGFLVVLYPLHAVLFWRTLRSELTFQSISRFQAAYRVLYLLVGVAVALSLAAH